MSSPKLHLYMLGGACSMAPHILLREAELPFTHTLFRRADVVAKGSYPEELLALNPKGKVPTLLYNDEVITENAALLTLTGQLVPEKQLLGTTVLETARVKEWLNYLATEIHATTFGMLFRPERFVDDPALKEHVRAKGREMLLQRYKYIDEQLEGKEWAVGERFTAADAYLMPFFWWGLNVMKMDMEGQYPNYARVVRNVKARPKAAEALKLEGVDF